MKTAIAAAVIGLAACAPAQAQEESKKDKICKKMYETAAQVMEARQAGVPLPNTISVFEEKMYREMVRIAYREPKFSTQEYKQRSIDRYANQWASSCYKNLEVGK
ncbi:hypothetical protein C7446_2534 [Kushneria sinocarnis]|uniref:Uncharacterized protein n=1 Tax=Kushneria sinocarnis TaxID=595502 RepID=A0A420WUJ6_9GAMM|nr:hypothetical protein [Kushneria sinocarnis]RKQ97115.1 hypothetical protein C7446_2534 [Kushneria sinocarnis]